MNWEEYEKNYLENSHQNQKLKREKLDYAKKLFELDLPIIYDQTHLSMLIGIDDYYLHSMSNSTRNFYRTFYIPKANGKKRKIDEPLPDLKKVQKWILKNILYNVKCSEYSKAYTPGRSIKGNCKFHTRKKIIVSMDIKNFFPSLKEGKVLNFFIGLGYNLEVSVLLTKLCCHNKSLPQGASTSGFLSNLILLNFDKKIGEFSKNRAIMYTRYADDMFFSGEAIEISELISFVKNQSKYLGLTLNEEKLKVMRNFNRQIVTGVVVNDKMQATKQYRDEIRKEVYYIKKFGLSDHLRFTEEYRTNYVQHLLGKLEYCLFLKPNDLKLKEYEKILVDLSK